MGFSSTRGSHTMTYWPGLTSMRSSNRMVQVLGFSHTTFATLTILGKSLRSLMRGPRELFDFRVAVLLHPGLHLAANLLETIDAPQVDGGANAEPGAARHQQPDRVPASRNAARGNDGDVDLLVDVVDALHGNRFQGRAAQAAALVVQHGALCLDRS